MTTEEAFLRGNNLLATAWVGLIGLGFVPEVFRETEWLFKIDEIILFLLAWWAIGWYNKGKNKFTRSAIPLLISFLALLTKIMAMVIEFKDAEDVGDDIGMLAPLLLAVILIGWLYLRSKKFSQT